MDLTVALCTRNRSSILPAAIEGLARQGAPLAWELLVVDNGSSDDTAAVARAAARDFPVPVRVVREESRGIAFARNRALRESDAEVMLFLDDDAVAREGWLQAHAAGYEDPTVLGTGGRILPVLPENAPSWFRAQSSDALGGPTSRYELGPHSMSIGPGTEHPAPFGANMGLRRDRALRAGGFRTDLGWGREHVPGEETELLHRLLPGGGMLVYLPDAIVDHHIESTRCTAAYYARWWRGLGRAQVRLAPPTSPGERLRRAARVTRKLVKWSVHSARDVGSERYARSLRKRATAQGRLRELLRRPSRSPKVASTPAPADPAGVA